MFPDAFNQNDDNTPSAPPVQFDLVPIRTGTQRQNSVTNNRQTMIWLFYDTLQISEGMVSGGVKIF